LKLFGSAAATSTPSRSILGEEFETSQPASNDKAADSKLDEIIKIMHARLPLFTQSQHLEVQERACFVSEVLTLYVDLQTTGDSIGSELASVFEEPLNPVSSKSQKKVPVPEGLDLDKWINEQPVDEYEPKEEEGLEGTDKGFEFLKNEDTSSSEKSGDEKDGDWPSEEKEKKHKSKEPKVKVQRTGVY